MQKVYINRIEHYLPLKKESNKQILKTAGKNKFDTKKWIDKIGIKSRRIVDKNIFSNDLAIESAKKIIKSINPNDIDYLIFCTNTPDFLLPTNACILQDIDGRNPLSLNYVFMHLFTHSFDIYTIPNTSSQERPVTNLSSFNYVFVHFFTHLFISILLRTPRQRRDPRSHYH